MVMMVVVLGGGGGVVVVVLSGGVMLALVVIVELAVVDINGHRLLVVMAARVEDKLAGGLAALVGTFQGLPFRR